jgi:hypothetical protein
MNTRKIAISREYGGFFLPHQAIESFLNKKGIAYEKKLRAHNFFGSKYYFTVNSEYFSCGDIARDDPILIETIVELGLDKPLQEMGLYDTALKIVEIPADVDWVLMEYDGCEWVAEKHRTWQ